jgi:transcriptional regulator with XRE-family HTH domain
MSRGIDPEWLGQRLRAVRRERGMTLQQVFDQTGVSVATLSRIERGSCKSLKSSTLVTLSDWMGTKVELLQEQPPTVVDRGKILEDTPAIVEFHLRADKNLDRRTATALANLFRAVYEEMTHRMRKG